MDKLKSKERRAAEKKRHEEETKAGRKKQREMGSGVGVRYGKQRLL